MRLLFVIVVQVLLLCVPIWGEEEVPPQLRDIKITEHLNERIDLKVSFTDETGRVVELGEYFNQGRAVVMNLVYYGCPALCGLVLNGVTKALKQVPGVPGKDYEVVTISIDHRETPRLAAAKKAAVIETLGKAGAEVGWHFLVGSEQNIRRVADQVGFGFKWVEQSQQFAHGAVTILLTADGRISRYLYGIEYEPRDFRLALTEAGEGKYGSAVDKLLLFCFHYDATVGSYVFFAKNIMRAGGILTVVILGIGLGRFWLKERQVV
ncbi:MAG: SCO family protein [Acidobacteriota bacterium]|nr:SCO family protein [Blastocatellia bacterium]MDW8413015.1 SCO family protein [Acidobacteriota bacterium]